MSKDLVRRLLGMDLITAGGVAELAQGSRVAVGHVVTATEENQSAGTIGKGAPEHFNTTLLLAGRNNKDV